MAIAQQTGRVEQRACDKCGACVEHEETVLLVEGSAPFWYPRKHQAPCGLVCLRGGVPLAVYRTGQVHGHRDGCPTCGALREEESRR